MNFTKRIHCIITIGLLVLVTMKPLCLKSQILKDSPFKIYRALVRGTITQFRLNSDKTYEIKVTEIQCSLCDFDELRKSINSKGNWTMKNDSIQIISEDNNRFSFLLIGETKIRPLFLIGMNLDSIPESRKVEALKKINKHELNDFHLVYDTYPDGMVKMIVDKYRMRRNEYEIEFNPDGSINSVKYFWDNKQRKRLE